MKIFINTTNWAIVKTENEFPSVVGDNYVDTLKVYYDVNPSTALIYPTITLLKPNGRKVGAFPFDAGTVENPVPFAYTDADSNTWYGFAFTLSSDDGQLTSVGRYQVTITTNKYKVVGTAPNESQVITNQRNTNIQLEVMNAVLNDNSDILILGESVDDVVASMYQLCQTLELDFATLTNSKADRSNADQTILADKIQTRLVEPKTLTGTLTLGYGGATITTKNGTNADSYVNVNSDDLVGISSDTKVKLGVNSYATKIEITDEKVKIDSPETAIAQLRVMQVDGLGSPITLNGNNATMHFTNDGLEVPSKFKIGNTDGDYWQFYGDTLSLKGSSHTIESNSGDAGITFDDNVLEFGAGNKVQVNAPTVNVDGNTVVLGDEPTSGGGGGIVINPTYSPSCLKVIKNATGSNAVVQVKTDTDKIPFEILKNGKMNITSGEVNFVGSTVKNTGVTGGKTYTSYFAPNAIQLQKQEGGNTSSPISIVTDAGVLISTDLMTLDPYEFYLKGGSRVSFGHPNTKVLFDNDNGAVYFQTSQSFTDRIYINNKKLATENYVDTQDNALQSQIDGINAGQNLADIVANLTALNNLDITNLKAGDKVQVLVDSNHDNASTVYSLVINGNTHSWSYIGKYGQDGYTKAEANALLALKADLTNTSQTITADKVKVNEIQPNQGGLLLNTDTVEFKSYTSDGSGDYPAGTYQWVQSGADLVLGKNNSDTLIALSPVGLVADTPDMLVNPQTFKSKTGALNIGLYNNEGMHNDLVGTTYASNSITSFVKYGNYNSNQVVVRNDYVRMSYDEFETAYSSVAVEKTGVYMTVGLIDRQVLQLSASTKKLTLGGNEIIDTANATTELFLTDAEMTTLLSEVFD